MRVRFWSALGLTLAIAVPAGAAGAKGDEAAARDKALLAYQHDLVSVLAPSADATPLLGAALLARPLAHQPKYNDFHSLIGRAAKADDAGPAVNWARLADCNNRAGSCPNPEALAALIGQAGDNAAVWLIKLGKDSKDGDEAQAREDLARAASSRLYDDYTGTSLKALANGTGMLPAPAEALDPDAAAGAYGLQVVMVYGVAALQPQPQPGMQAAASLCSGNPDDPGLKQDCLKLARLMEWGSSPLSRSLGLHLRATLSDDPAARESARVARDNLTWQVRKFAELSARAPNDKTLAQHLLLLARSGGTEMSTVLAALRDAGIPADAPAAAEQEPVAEAPAR